MPKVVNFGEFLKITEKVSFNITSEAAIYILSGQKFIKNAKNGQFEFGEVLKT